MANEFRYVRRIFRSYYPLSSRILGTILEEIQAIFCQYFGNTIDRIRITDGKVNELIDELKAFYETTWETSDDEFSNYMNLLTNIKNSHSRKT